MRYVGGKSRLWKPIVAAMGDLAGRPYIEPFCGSAVVLSHVQGPLRIGNDAHPYLIALLAAIAQGWDPPESVSVEEYKDVQFRQTEYPPELVGFVGFGCSFAAKWFGGYARGEGRNFARESRDNLLQQAKSLRGVHWVCGEYDQCPLPKNSLVYCDPPYAGTQGYSVGAFDSARFYEWCREVSRQCEVYISEFSAPLDFECVWEKSRAASLDRNTGGKVSVDRLYRVRP